MFGKTKLLDMFTGNFSFALKESLLVSSLWNM